MENGMTILRPLFPGGLEPWEGQLWPYHEELFDENHNDGRSAKASSAQIGRQDNEA